MQSLWKENLDWDQPLSAHFSTAWTEYLKDLTPFTGKQIPRCISIQNSIHFQLHGFSDTSKKAYAGVVYLRSVSSTGHINVALIAAKDKVAPVHQISLPRLELLGALLLADIMEVVVRALPITADIYGWTDSTIV
ncbi:unnamed protein product [Allacma fusca]|uniref:Uncharacterized protein n=1 Tax=Allacma fusca TaxID=39272 RepID=A0A8J2JF20_9HEXA|nr:unnamed protein product [Allacma fusca]